MVVDATTHCIERCLALADAAADAASHCLRRGGDHAEAGRVNSLVACSAVTRMIAERLQGESGADDSLLALGVDVCRTTDRICTELGDPYLLPCRRSAGACSEALRVLQELA